MSRLSDLRKYGQSFWLDHLSPAMIGDGSLQRRIVHQRLGGAIIHPGEIETGGRNNPAEDLYLDSVIEAVRTACDLLGPLHRSSEGVEGVVSVAIPPHLAREPSAGLRQVREWWRLVERPNLLIELPATRACIPGIEELLYRGVNVNISLLFGLPDYWDSFHAYMRALERRFGEARPLAGVTSVASFHLREIDVAIDRRLAQVISEPGFACQRAIAGSLYGRTAVVNAKLAYASFRALLASDRWSRLERHGARPQRLAWVATRGEAPKEADLCYVESLIGPFTIAALDGATAGAFEGRGTVASTLERGLDEARGVMRQLNRLGIDLNAIAATPVAQGVDTETPPRDPRSRY